MASFDPDACKAVSPDGAGCSFSVVIPVYNRPDHVRACLAPFLLPEASGLDVVVVDDGSTDETPEVVRALATQSRGATIRLVVQSNSGPGPARNRGMDEALNDWVVFHDSDDIWLPWGVGVMKNALACPEAAKATVLFIEAVRFHENAELDRVTEAPVALRLHDTLLDMRLDDPITTVSSCNVGFRRSVFQALGGFTGAVRHSEDTDLFYRANECGPVLVIGQPAIMGYRQSLPGSVTQTNSGDAIRYVRTRFLIDRNKAGLYPGPADKRNLALARTVAFTVRDYFAEGHLGAAYRVWWQGVGLFLAAGQWSSVVKLPLTPLLHYLRPGRYRFRWSRKGGPA
ncbi:glycosyltransferase family 2 protein [Fuscibacter oryzae]|uniref:Glycosyltransferase family 2 protein n=1 Tax=Fuscibacter oryzae TaxID=2803939 RepID=A0A8J7MWE5_9RHOB|nr:glycosyltransferase family 2 protein [Fuscibacter oryzae]MBL4930070.1 glycosyltransferase family 2 protein [Fuscibacter oryzae]